MFVLKVYEVHAPPFFKILRTLLSLLRCTGTIDRFAVKHMFNSPLCNRGFRSALLLFFTFTFSFEIKLKEGD